VIIYIFISIWIILYLIYKFKNKYTFGLKCKKCNGFIKANEDEVVGNTYTGKMPKVCPHCGSLNYNNKKDKYEYIYATGKSDFKINDPSTWFISKYTIIETEDKFKKEDNK
jgi:RecJ-like exonuclease